MLKQNLTLEPAIHILNTQSFLSALWSKIGKALDMERAQTSEVLFVEDQTKPRETQESISALANRMEKFASRILSQTQSD